MRFSFLNSIKDTIWWDNIDGTSGEDMIEIGFGDDTVHAKGGDDVIWDMDGAYSEDIWLGSNDKIYAQGGDDLIFAGWGADTIDGGSGWDEIDYRYSRTGVTVDLKGGKGYGDSDSASKGDIISSIEEVTGSSHNDTLTAGSGHRVLDGANGNDVLHGGSGETEMFGGSGNDTLNVGSVDNTVNGGDGVDLVNFYKLNHGVAISSIFGPAMPAEALVGAQRDGASNVENYTLTRYSDYLDSSTYEDVNNIVNGKEGADTIFTGRGSDTLYGGTGGDTLDGGMHADRLYGEDGNDKLFGGNDDDRLFGGAGNDTLNGGQHNDVMDGGAGNDRFEASHGVDTMTGGAGNDTFVYTRFDINHSQADIITDFARGQDKIDLSAIDANAGVSGDQAFVFKAAAGLNFKSNFSTDLKSHFGVDVLSAGDAGTITASIEGGKTFISAYLDADPAADFVLTLNGQHNLTGSNFIL